MIMWILSYSASELQKRHPQFTIITVLAWSSEKQRKSLEKEKKLVQRGRWKVNKALLQGIYNFLISLSYLPLV